MKQHRIGYTKIAAFLAMLGFCSIMAQATPIPSNSYVKPTTMTSKESSGIKKSMQQRIAEFKERLAQRHQKMTKNAGHALHPPAAPKQSVTQQHTNTKTEVADKESINATMLQKMHA